MRIALVQFGVEIQKDFAYTTRKVEQYLQTASEKGCSIVCFPEDFWFGPLDYYSQEEVKVITTREREKAIIWLQQKAKQYRLHIIAGSFIEKTGHTFQNIATVIDKKGTIQYRYAKQQPVPYGFEGKYLKAGTTNRVITFDAVKIGILICRDLAFPQLAQNLRKQGVEMIIVLSFWPKRSNDYLNHKLSNQYNLLTEMRTVDVWCQARSFENEAALLYVNASGNLKNKSNFDVLLGRTQVCLPFYGCINKLNKNREGMIVFDYDKSIVSDARRAYQLG